MIDPNELNLEDRLAKAVSEGNHWFKEARDQYKRAEHLAGVIRTLREELKVKDEAVEEMAAREAKNVERLKLITSFWHAARKTGYDTSWSIGGITVEKLREELKNAESYKRPKKVLPNIVNPEMLNVGTAQIRDGVILLDTYRVTGSRPMGAFFKNLYIVKE